jgi:hypothetical protein
MSGDGNAQRSEHFGRLIERGGLIRDTRPFGILQDDDAVALGTGQFLESTQLVAVVDRFADPHPALVIDVHAGRVDKQWLRGPEFHLQAGHHLEGGLRLGRRHLSVDLGKAHQHQSEKTSVKKALHDGFQLRKGRGWQVE